MLLSVQSRIARDRLAPRIVALWHALAPLQTVVSFMNTGAHPDDETSAMLAAMGLRDGIDLSYACSTRGEGGQNDIGTETTEALGVLRTAEMERACDLLNLRMYWLSESPDDTIFDFGFSKSGVETMEKWGRERTLKRFVDIVRAERPDIICPTFLDIPGQHGHHRAMTEAAHLVMDLCADPAYALSDLPPWQIKKLYLPAWSGAGQAYDDDLPPPPATLVIRASGVDPITGFSYEKIGQQSRTFHKTQAMGRWIATGTERDWPLHLADSRVEGPDDTLFSGLPTTLRDLGYGDAQDHIDAARAAFPDFDAIARHACKAVDALGQTDLNTEYAHKVVRKQQQLAQVIRIASGAKLDARLTRNKLHATDTSKVEIELNQGDATTATAKLSLPDNWGELHGIVTLDKAAISDPYPSTYFPDAPRKPCVALDVTCYGTTTRTYSAFEVPPVVVPDRAADVAPLADVINIATAHRTVSVSVANTSPENAKPGFDVPCDWALAPTETGFDLTAPENVAPGRYSIPLTLDNINAQTVRLIEHEHIDPRALTRPANVQIQVIDTFIPKGRVGYVGGGNDRVGYWLARMGVDVSTLSDQDLQSDTALAEYDCIVIGIFALKFRTGLDTQMARLHQWAKDGGTLVTLYHRPWDNWNPDATPPARLEIGQPSLRWRVTDENATVTQLTNHPVLSTPNDITAEDWSGWHKERGLYFAKSWDDAYTPLIEMADPSETPHQGALLVADIGKGRHIHCALILHHQMEKLVPGAFRIMANLLAKRG